MIGPAGSAVDLPLLFGNATDQGRVRTRNEDYLAYYRSGERHLFVVADGMGGEAGGQEASHIAVECARTVFESGGNGPPDQLLRHIVDEANLVCIAAQAENDDLVGMGTTLDLLLIDRNQAWWAHVGDGRIYLVRDRAARVLTRDHTRVGEMVRNGFLSAEEALDHPLRNVVTSIIGREESAADISAEPLELRAGDRLVMCTDGLHDLVTAAEIGQMVGRFGPQPACKALIDLANHRGGTDNSTVQIIYRGEPLEAWRQDRMARTWPQRARPYLYVAAALAVVTIIAFGLLRLVRKAGNAPTLPTPAMSLNVAAMRSVAGAHGRIEMNGTGIAAEGGRRYRSRRGAFAGQVDLVRPTGTAAGLIVVTFRSEGRIMIGEVVDRTSLSSSPVWWRFVRNGNTLSATDRTAQSRTVAVAAPKPGWQVAFLAFTANSAWVGIGRREVALIDSSVAVLPARFRFRFLGASPNGVTVSKVQVFQIADADMGGWWKPYVDRAAPTASSAPRKP